LPIRSAKAPIWLLPNLLSLDAPLIALVWQQCFAAAAHIALLPAARTVLALAVWAIYVGDRLLDSRTPQEIETPRHRFHREHRVPMTILLGAIVIAAAACALIALRPVIVRNGIFVAAGVGLYLAAVHAGPRRFSGVASKEWTVALIFAVGTIIAPWSRATNHLALAIGTAGFFLTSAANTIGIEIFEWHTLHCQSAPPPHPATRWMAGHYTGFMAALIGAGAAAAMLPMTAELRGVFVAIAIAAAALLVLNARRDRVSAAAYRVLADTALLSPVAVWALRLL
jgi:hypothetical protein